MSKEVSRALADFLELSSQQLLAVLSRELNKPEAVSLFDEFLQEQVGFLRGGAAHTSEWVQLFVESVRRDSGQIAQIVQVIQRTRDILFSFCSGKIDNVSDAQLYAVLLECEGAILKQAVQTFCDIERKKAAAALRRQKTLVTSMRHAFVTLNADGIVELSNSHFSNLVGVAEERVPGTDFMSLCHPNTASELHRLLRQKRAGAASSFNGRIMTAQGEISSVQFWVLPMLDENGFRNGLAITMTKLDSTVPFSSGGFSQVLEEIATVLGVGFYVIDREFCVARANELGHFLVQTGQKDEDTDNSRIAFDTGKPQHAVVQIKTPADDARWVEMASIPLRNETGKLTHVAKLARDVTEQKMIEAQLLHQQRESLVWHLAAGMAHQIRNPLGVMIGFAEMLSQGMPPDRVSEAVESILRNGMRCKEIVESLMEFGQGASGEFSRVNLNDLIRERVATVYGDPRIDYQLAEDLPDVDCAPDQIALVVLNLVDNALRAARTYVTVKTEHADDMVRLKVCDDGPGVDEQCRPKLFEPFVTTRKDEGGTGLGLCLSRRAVDLHHGRLMLQDSSEKGSCFVMTLPSAAQELPSESAEIPPAPRTKTGRRVLLVEDENDQLFLLTLALQMQGHESDTAKTGAHAVEMINANAYDAIVIDMLLGDEMGGRDLYRILERSNPDLAERTLFITGDTMKFETRRFLQEVKRPYLEKPFLVADFTAEVERLIDTDRCGRRA